MRRTSKGFIKMTTHGLIPIRKTGVFDNFTEMNILNDFIEAAKLAGFPVTFEVFEPVHDLPVTSTLGNGIKEMTIKIVNFKPVSFMMSLPTAPQEDQQLFKAWSKFWTSLTKLGYNVK